MATVTIMEKNFADTFMEQVVQWVQENYSIDDLFTTNEIESWLEDNAKTYGYVMED